MKSYVTFDHASLIIGGIVAILAGIIMLGGGKRISRVTEVLVPAMALAYIAVSLIVVIMNIKSLPAVTVQSFHRLSASAPLSEVSLVQP